MLSPARNPINDESDQAIAAIAKFMRGFSLEATRPTTADIEELRRAAPAGTQVYLSALPSRALAETVTNAVAIRAAGFVPVPHIAARNIKSREELTDFVARLSEGAAVRRVLVIAGDRERPAGPFTDALDVIESGILQQHGITEVGVSGYPEGHPRIASAALDLALTAKVEAAEQSGLKVHIVTQFGFDAGAILRWIEHLRDLGFEQSVSIGMAGPTDLATLLRFAARCGVRASAGSAARQAGLLKKLFAVSTPDAIVRTLARSGLGGVTPHFYSFGGLGAAARWTSATADGRITLENGAGFSVTPP